MDFKDNDPVFRSFFDHAVEGIFLTTPAGKYLIVNRRLAAIYGFDSPEELVKHFENIQTQLYVDPRRRDTFIREVQTHGELMQFESEIRRKDGSIIWISENARTVKDENGRVLYYEGTVTDITERKRMEAALERQQLFYHQLFFNSPLAMVLLDADRNVMACNPSFEQLFGYRLYEIQQKSVREKIIPGSLLAEAENYRAAILGGISAPKETLRKHRDGREIPVSLQAFPVIVENAIAGIYYIYEDITERKNYEITITRQAFHDSLTGLPNRNLFNERLKRAIERSKRRGSYHYAVVLLDLDRFKKVNDTLGHMAGDELLCHVSDILEKCVRSVDTAARLGGDEFALILEEFLTKQDVLHILDRIHSLLGEPIEIMGSTIHAAASMGIVLSTEHYTSAEDLLRDADIAMYRAKEHRKPYEFFSQDMQKELLEIMEIESSLKEALKNNELQLYYQPIVTLAGNRLEGFEALLRWMHPERGMISPDRFIPIAEDTGMILPIGKWVIREACRQLQAWSRENPQLKNLIMSVNVSIRQFTQIDLAEEVRQALARFEIKPAQLRLEITESTLIRDLDEVLIVIQSLKEMGVKIAIDDFGTGYSSLSYLQHLPIDCLKIDRSFISGGKNSADAFHIVKSVTTLARSLGISVVAEGVEDSRQRDLLIGLECDNAQGFLYSEPMNAGEAKIWATEQGFNY